MQKFGFLASLAAIALTGAALAGCDQGSGLSPEPEQDSAEADPLKDSVESLEEGLAKNEAMGLDADGNPKVEASPAAPPANDKETITDVKTRDAGKSDAAKADVRPDGMADESQSMATGKPSRCVIKSKAGEYKGDCLFESSGGASFAVTRKGNAAFAGGITQYVLEADTSTEAGFSGRDAEGNLNYLGIAIRSKTQPACWEGESDTVCVYAK